jgi:hypothetical protein
MATPDSNTNAPYSAHSKPKRRFQIREIATGLFVAFDEGSGFWVNGHVMGAAYLAGDYFRKYHNGYHSREQAEADLPSVDEVERLPIDTPLVSVRITRQSDKWGNRFTVFPDEAERIQKSLDARDTLIRWESITGQTGYIAIQDIVDISFGRI